MSSYENARKFSSVVKLTPNHPDLQPTYHGSVDEAHKAADHQSSHYGGFRYDVHENGKHVVANRQAYGVEKTKQAQVYNSNAKASRR